MPILPEEVSLYPDDLLNGFTDATTDRKWVVYWTRARQEKALARRLLKQKIPFYLPLVGQDRLISGRRMRSLLPLFAGYVFSFSSEQECLTVSKTNRVARTLLVKDHERLLAELRQIKRIIDLDVPLTVERRLQPGQRVRVKSGAMVDFEGTVVCRRGKRRLAITVDFLQQGVSVEIDDVGLEPI